MTMGGIERGVSGSYIHQRDRHDAPHTLGNLPAGLLRGGRGSSLSRDTRCRCRGLQAGPSDRDDGVPVTFGFPARLAPSARNVSVIGAFNAWNPTAHPMRRRGDEWTTTVYLPAGRVVYLFSVDRTIWLDPGDDERLPNGWGSEYSVRDVAQRLVPSR
jgi:hypothetical protein